MLSGDEGRVIRQLWEARQMAVEVGRRAAEVVLITDLEMQWRGIDWPDEVTGLGAP